MMLNVDLKSYNIIIRSLEGFKVITFLEALLHLETEDGDRVLKCKLSTDI